MVLIYKHPKLSCHITSMYINDGLIKADALAACRAHRGLPVGFLLLWYSVLFTVESLSLLCLLVVS